MNKIKLQKRYWVAVAAFALVIIVAGRIYGIYAKNAAIAAKGSSKMIATVETAIAKQGIIAADIAASGTVQGIQEVAIAAKSAGRIQSISVTDGSHVNAGQVLVELDGSEIRAQLGQALANKAQALANRENAKLLTQRLGRLFQEDAVARQQLDNAQTQYNVYDAQVAQSNAAISLYQAQLANMTLSAPFSGRVANKRVIAGDLAAPNQVLMSLVDTSQIKVEIALGENDLGKVKVGQTASFSVDAFPGETFTATVSEISPAADLKSRTFKVWLTGDNKDGKLRSGLFARLSLHYSQKENALIVPKDALLIRDKKAYVFVVEQDTAILTPIAIGLENAKEAEILSGVSAGAAVSVWGHENLNDKDKVAIQKREEK